MKADMPTFANMVASAMLRMQGIPSTGEVPEEEKTISLVDGESFLHYT